MAMPYEEATATPEYRSAFAKAMNGAEATFTEAERAAVTRVRQLAGTAVGYPIPPAQQGRGAPAPSTRVD